MRKMILIAVLTIGFSVIPFLIRAEVYKWIDDKGDVHFTDDYSNIPEKYRPVTETQRSPKETPSPSVEKEPIPVLVPKIPEPAVQETPAVQKTPSVVREVFEGVMTKLSDLRTSLVVTSEKETMTFSISKDTKIIDELGKEVPFEDLERRMSVTASGVPVSVRYIRDGEDIHASHITIRAQKEFQWGDHRRPIPPKPPRPPQ